MEENKENLEGLFDEVVDLQMEADDLVSKLEATLENIKDIKVGEEE